MFNDLAYLLGLICGRGILDYSQRVVSIHFPFKSIEATGITKNFNQRDKLIIGLDPIISRLIDFTGKPIKKVNHQKHIDIRIYFYSNTHTWQNIVSFFNHKQDFHYFNIPNYFYQAPTSVKKNFLQGFADVAGFIRKGNVDQSGRYRVYLEIPNKNWYLPVQICRILQMHDINIPVQTITWGHPNIRGESNWAKEHQIKIYAEYFIEIGFLIDYKNQILKEFADANIIKFGFKKRKFCNPRKKVIRNLKPRNADEKSLILPKEIRGVHFNAYWEICCALGCGRNTK